MTISIDRPFSRHPARSASQTMRQRRKHPDQHSVKLGSAQMWLPLRLPVEEHAIFRSPPRKGKSALLASIILRYPGPVVSTSTKHDMWKLTVRVRREVGRPDVFNPQGIGGPAVASTFAWDIIGGTPGDPGCLDIQTAIRRADAFAFATSSSGLEDSGFWQSKASDYLRALFFAAAWARSQGHARYNLATAARWALSDASEEAEDILKDAGAGDWGAQVQELRGEAAKTAATVRMVMTRALSFMTDPALAAAVLPKADDPGFRIEEFVSHSGTLYMIAGGGQNAPLAPLNACLVNEIHHVASVVGSRNTSGRLADPMLLALDELCQIVPLPDLPGMMADSGGKGIQIIPVIHGDAALRERYGTDGARKILDCAGTEVTLPGVSDPDTLKALSVACGTISLTQHGGDQYSDHPVMTEGMIRGLRGRHALVLRDNLSPVIAKVSSVFTDPVYLKSKLKDLPQTARHDPPKSLAQGEVIDPDGSDHKEADDD